MSQKEDKVIYPPQLSGMGFRASVTTPYETDEVLLYRIQVGDLKPQFIAVNLTEIENDEQTPVHASVVAGTGQVRVASEDEGSAGA